MGMWLSLLIFALGGWGGHYGYSAEGIVGSTAIKPVTEPSAANQPLVDIYTPRTHVALSGPFSVQWGPLPAAPFSEVSLYLKHPSDPSPSCQRATPASHHYLEFPCDCLAKPGTWTVGIRYRHPASLEDWQPGSEELYGLNTTGALEEGFWAQTQNFEVVWPSMELVLPSQAFAQSSSVAFSFHSSSPLCLNPAGNEEEFRLKTTLDLYFASGSESNFSKIQPSLWSGNLRESIGLKIDCSVLDREGEYLVRLAGEDGEVMAESNQMKVTWYPHYSLTTMKSTVFPCVGKGFNVLIHGQQPICPSASGIRVRVHAILDKVDNPLYDPWALEYKGERPVTPSLPSVLLPCGTFDQVFPGYCFSLVSVSESAHVHSHARKCIRTKSRANPIVSAWSSWSVWGQCTVSCGGGVRHRQRKCQASVKLSAGQFLCPGETVDRSRCGQEACPDNSPSIPKQPHLVRPSGPCVCGCTLSSPGLLVLSRVCKNQSFWILEGRLDGHVKLALLETDIRFGMISLLVRDGPSSSSPVLFHSRHQPAQDFHQLTAHPLISSGNALHVRFQYEPTSIKPGSVDSAGTVRGNGVVMLFEFLDNEQYQSYSQRHGPRDSDSSSWPSFWLWLAILLASVLFTLTAMVLAAVLFQRYTKRRLKLKLNLLMSESMQTSASASLGQYYDPIKLGNRMSADSIMDKHGNGSHVTRSANGSKSAKYHRISGSSFGTEDSTPVKHQMGGDWDEDFNQSAEAELPPNSCLPINGGNKLSLVQSNSSPGKKVTAIIEPSFQTLTRNPVNNQQFPGSRTVDAAVSTNKNSRNLVSGYRNRNFPNGGTSASSVGTSSLEEKDQSQLQPLLNGNGVKLLPSLQGIPEVPEDFPNDGTLRALKPANDEQTMSPTTTTTLASTPKIGIAQPYLRSEISPSPQLHPKHRSIGIQLNSPSVNGGGMSRRRLSSLNSSLRSSLATLATPSGRTSPCSVDFEYDYYEPEFVPGSFFNPVDANFIDDELNIDDIIAGSELMRDAGNDTPTPPNEEK